MSRSEESSPVQAIMLMFLLDEIDSRWDRLIGSELCVLRDAIENIFFVLRCEYSDSHTYSWTGSIHLQDEKRTTGQLAAPQVFSMI
jgi:hypothetical protein